jgi:aromatic-L-amino-acid decarboxylase
MSRALSLATAVLGRAMNDLEISVLELSRLAEEALRLTKDYWDSLDGRAAYPKTNGQQTLELFSRPWPADGRRGEVLGDFELIAAHSRPSNGKFFGYISGSGEPIGAIAELLIAVLNQNVTSWRSGPAAASIERTVVGWLAQAVGCTGFVGSLCGGGSAANLMALAMAREARCPANEDGAPDNSPEPKPMLHGKILGFRIDFTSIALS